MVELSAKSENGKIFEVLSDGESVGKIECKDFWEGMPYLYLIELRADCRGTGIGDAAMKLLEGKLKADGAKALLVSTQSDECAQNFYRKIGYSECGCLILENTPFTQPMEMFFIKVL